MADFQCPTCGHKWSGQAALGSALCEKCGTICMETPADDDDVHAMETMQFNPSAMDPQGDETEFDAETMPPEPVAPMPPSPAPEVAEEQTIHLNPEDSPTIYNEESAPPRAPKVINPEVTEMAPTMPTSPPVNQETRAPQSPPRVLTPEDSDMGETMPAAPPRREVSEAEMPTQPPTISQTAPTAPRPQSGGSARVAARPGKINLSGQSVGGYKVYKMIGHGGMGAVALARQVSLDRDVALKILPGEMASNADFLMRFTREALSAAQLTHHNIIQVYDIGNDDGVHYISLEFVEGENLGDMVRRDGKFEPEDAAAYVLQAARGLDYAHRRGIIHRDIKPDNIMVNKQGIVKIADMGLAKIVAEVEKVVNVDEDEKNSVLMKAKGELTMGTVAMGTPAYMAPEQGRDAANVDGRADMYSLGCTLYYLIVGKAPYSGTTAYEIISKHQMEPLPAIETQVRNLPPVLGVIIRKMLEKNVEDRYPKMSDVVRELETFLGLQAEAGQYRPREEHVQTLEGQLARYNAAPALKLRKLAPIGFFGIMTIIMLVGGVLGSYPVVGATIGIMALTPLISFIINGFATKNYLFRRVRSVFFGMTAKGWFLTIGGSLLVAVMLYILDLILSWALVGFLGAGLAIAYQFVVARPLRKQREEPLNITQDMLKQLRIRGVSEDALMDFMYRFSGAHWEEFFEEFFGYENMLLARGKWAKTEKVKPRKRFGIWRDPIARSLVEIEEERKKLREKKTLAKAEASRLKSEGISEADAEKQAAAMASQIMDEGLLQPTAPLMPGVSADMVAKPGGKAKNVNVVSKPNLIFRLIRMLVGGVVGGVYGALYFQPNALASLPGFVQRMIESVQFAVGQSAFFLPGNLFGMVLGVLLFLTVFTKRVFMPLVALIGVIVFVGRVPLDAQIPNPVVTPNLLAMAGGGLALLALVIWPILRKVLFGKK